MSLWGNVRNAVSKGFKDTQRAVVKGARDVARYEIEMNKKYTLPLAAGILTGGVSTAVGGAVAAGGLSGALSNVGRALGKQNVPDFAKDAFRVIGGLRQGTILKMNPPTATTEAAPAPEPTATAEPAAPVEAGPGPKVIADTAAPAARFTWSPAWIAGAVVLTFIAAALFYTLVLRELERKR